MPIVKLLEVLAHYANTGKEMLSSFIDIWDKMGYNSACRGDFCAYRVIVVDGPSNAGNCIFSPTDPLCHGNEIWDEMGYKSACVY